MDDNKKRASPDTYKNRYGRLSDGRASNDEKMGGMKRIDFSMDNAEFGGLTRKANLYGKEGWAMKVLCIFSLLGVSASGLSLSLSYNFVACGDATKLIN